MPTEQPLANGPLPIKRLHETLINRIAAGEIIHRPSSALKELIENCLDAGSTSIKVTVKEGGLKLLQIQDNGSGIRKSDLAILCERFTTSKLSKFSDLSSIVTHGFRGEALASISHVAHLSVVTKTKQDSCAWKACYIDGVLAPHKPGQSSEPKAFAGNDGTLITVEDLFYNTPTRLSALKSASDEYARILDVVTRYATHNPQVAFTCKKAGSSTPDLSTPSSSTVDQTIRVTYGHAVAKELIHITFSSESEGKGKETQTESSTEWKMDAYVTNANHQAKRATFLLFINHRLVESSRIKRAIDNVYGSVLPKGACPFIYISLEIDPQDVDVNVHPTKREVHFLNEEAIVEAIANVIQEKLTSQSESRAFEYQTLLTGGVAATPSTVKERSRPGNDLDSDTRQSGVAVLGSSGPTKPMYSHHKVRTSGQDRTLDSMFPVSSPLQRPSTSVASGSGSPANAAPYQIFDLVDEAPKGKEIRESECFLTSVVQLREKAAKDRHALLTEIIRKHIFVGIVDLYRGLSLVQHLTKLYLINHAAFSEELFYQLGLRQFGNFNKLKLEPAPSLRTLIKIAAECDRDLENSGLDVDEVVETIAEMLINRRDMLNAYFCLTITEEGMIESIPILLKGYTPDLDRLPRFLLRLGPQVEWSSEIGCFTTLLRELAYFYAPRPLTEQCGERDVIQTGIGLEQDAKMHNEDEEMRDAEEVVRIEELETRREMKGEPADEEKSDRWQIEHVLFPTMRRYLEAPKTLLEHDIVQVANLPDLYKVFERC